MGKEFIHRVKGWLTSLGFLLLVLLIIAVGEWLPLMPAIQRFQEVHPSLNQALIVVAIVMNTLGILLLALTQFLVKVPDKDQPQPSWNSKTQGTVKGRGWLFSGTIITAGFSDEARIWRVRKAFRDGEWWRVPRWRRFSLMMLGAILLFFGLFGLLFLLFPPGVKFLLLLAVIYGTVRSIYAFATDQPTPD
jgi:hypothetical protein